MAQVSGASVVIIGGGVTGLSSGWWLARAGIDVLVLEKGIVGWEASGRNGGGATHVYSPFGLEEQKLWPQMDELLGYPTEYQPNRIKVALDAEQLALYRRTADIATERGFRTDLLDVRQLKELVPIIGDNAVGGTYMHFGGHANPQRTVQAYAWALQDHGGRILQHTTATGLSVRGGRVVAVETDRGAFAADLVIVAAGPQTGFFAAMVGAYLPLAPARVEMIVTEPLPLMFRGGVDGNGLYGRQVLRGNLVYGGGPHEWIQVDGMATPDRPTTDARPEPGPPSRGAVPGRRPSPADPELGRDRGEHAGRGARRRPPDRAGQRDPRHDVERRLRPVPGGREGHQRDGPARPLPLRRPRCAAT